MSGLAAGRSGSARLERDYWKVWTSSSVSTFGDGVYLTALPLLGATLTRDPVELSLVTVAATLPWLLFGLPSGALVDRLDHRRLMVATDLARFAVVTGLAVVLATGHLSIPLLIMASFVLSIGETLYIPASQSIVPAIVSRVPERLQRANSRLTTAQILFRDFVGRPAGGALFGVASWLPVAVNALSFGTGAAALIRISDVPERQRPPRRGLAPEIAEGLRWLWGHQVLRPLALAVGVNNLAVTAWMSVLVLSLQDDVGLGSVGFGAVTAVQGIGGIAGGMLSTAVTRRVGTAGVLTGGLVVEGVATLVLGWSGSLALICGMLFVLGFCAIAWNVVSVSLRQSILPEHLYGRVNSAFRLVAVAGAPLGAVVGGMLGKAVDLDAPFVFGGVVVLLSAVLAMTVLTPDALARAVAEPVGPRAGTPETESEGGDKR